MLKTNSTPISTSAGAITAALTTAIGYLAGIDYELTQIDWSVALNWLAGLTGLGAAVGHLTSDRTSNTGGSVQKHLNNLKLKNWFSKTELQCKGTNCDCEYIGISPVTLGIANELRNKFGKIFCSSGYRCEQHNSDTKGSARGSLHVLGRAMDLMPEDAEPVELYEYLCKTYPNQYGFGLYSKFVHIDDRGGVFGRKPSPASSWKQYELPDIDLIK